MAQAITATPTALAPLSNETSTPRRRGRLDDSLAVSSRVSSWRVEHELGRGGMSSVHAVVHAKFGKRAAIKIAHRSVLGTGGMSSKTFLREARIVHAVEHPAMIDVFATGTYDGRPYLVMEKLVGTPLGRRVDDGPLPRREAIEILLELCHVLRAAHGAGIVHRDLKLDNVFLCDVPFADGRRVKLLDWGVAYVDGEDDPFCGLIAGTLTYVAPEQIRGDRLTGAADLYSLAVLAYHLLCRRPPFVGTDLALLNMHLRADPPPPRTAWPDVPHALDQLLVRMLAKQPEERPSLDEIEDVLRASLGCVEQPIQFAEGSAANIPLPLVRDERAWYVRWLKARSARPIDPDDVLDGPIISLAPPFRPTWIALGLAAAALATLVSALP